MKIADFLCASRTRKCTPQPVVSDRTQVNHPSTEAEAIRAVKAYFEPENQYKTKADVSNAFGISRQYFNKVETKMQTSGALQLVRDGRTGKAPVPNDVVGEDTTPEPDVVNTDDLTIKDTLSASPDVSVWSYHTCFPNTSRPWLLAWLVLMCR